MTTTRKPSAWKIRPDISRRRAASAAVRRAFTAMDNNARSAMVSARAAVFREARTAAASSVMALASRAAVHCLSATSTRFLRVKCSGGCRRSSENGAPSSIIVRQRCSWASWRWAAKKIDPTGVPAVRTFANSVSKSAGRPANAASTRSSSASSEASETTAVTSSTPTSVRPRA